jgi:hypothetical protein
MRVYMYVDCVRVLCMCMCAGLIHVCVGVYICMLCVYVWLQRFTNVRMDVNALYVYSCCVLIRTLIKRTYA